MSPARWRKWSNPKSTRYTQGRKITVPASPQGKWTKPTQKRARLHIEWLEDRTLLSAFYDLAVLADTTADVPITFRKFGDLVTISNQVHTATAATAPVGTVAFVGFTDRDHNGDFESGLWVAPAGYLPTNINPSFSDTDGRDFGRAVDLNDNGVLIGRDRYNGAPAQYFVRKWSQGEADQRTNIASANNVLEPDFGQFSAISTAEAPAGPGRQRHASRFATTPG